jgi:hypothetical protein
MKPLTRLLAQLIYLGLLLYSCSTQGQIHSAIQFSSRSDKRPSHQWSVEYWYYFRGSHPTSLHCFWGSLQDFFCSPQPAICFLMLTGARPIICVSLATVTGIILIGVAIRFARA